MGVQPTSLEAYTDMLYQLGEKQETILEIIRTHPNVSNHDIARILKWEINRVTPRVYELRNMDLVLDNGLKIDRLTGRRVMKWISAK
jgi:Mn-dependent DtxR family transcriptional regulator